MNAFATASALGRGGAGKSMSLVSPGGVVVGRGSDAVSSDSDSVPGNSVSSRGVECFGDSVISVDGAISDEESECLGARAVECSAARGFRWVFEHVEVA